MVLGSTRVAHLEESPFYKEGWGWSGLWVSLAASDLPKLSRLVLLTVLKAGTTGDLAVLPNHRRGTLGVCEL